MKGAHVLVVGSAGIDIKARPLETPLPGSPNPGEVRSSVGGVARNIAENLARLEVPTVLLTAVGNDAPGRRALRVSERAGIDCQYVRRLRDQRTSTYVALLEPDGQLHTGISDFKIIDAVNSDYLMDNERLFNDAKMIVIDATLTEETLATVFELAARYRVKVAADPTSPALAPRLCPFMSQLYLVAPNAAETAAMCGTGSAAYDRDSAIQAARNFVAQGAEIAVVTLGAEGLAYADGGGAGFLRAIHTRVVDPIGAGDAFSGAAIFGLVNDVPVDEAMRLGITAASLTLQSRYTVLPELTQELLYAKLMA